MRHLVAGIVVLSSTPALVEPTQPTERAIAILGVTVIDGNGGLPVSDATDNGLTLDADQPVFPRSTP